MSLELEPNLDDLLFPPSAICHRDMMEMTQSLTGGSSGESPYPSAESIISAEGVKAFNASLWHWDPGPADTRALNEPDPTAFGADDYTATPDASQFRCTCLNKSLGHLDRDRMLSLILDQCEKASVARIATSFPPPPILDKLLRTGLHFQAVGSPLAWIHVPTFSVQCTSSELLCALIAYGALLSSLESIQAFGTAIAGLLFNKIMQQWIRKNSTTRNIELAQAYSLVQRLLLWAGSQRTMEFGEGISQPLITIMRRSGMLREHHLPLEAVILHNKQPSELENTWKAWVRKESTIRLAHQIFLNDIQTSMTVSVDPLLSCSEMTLSLPVPDNLWYAASAEEWRERYMSSKIEKQPRCTLSGLVRDSFLLMHCGNPLPEQATTTSSITTALLLYGLWDSIWNCQQRASWLRSAQSLVQGSLSSVTAHSELVSRVLQQFNPLPTCTPSLTTQHGQQHALLCSTPEQRGQLSQNLLLFHYLNLALHAPIQAFMQFAGKEGETEAQRAFLLLQEWTQARDGRRSLWHAAQVYRFARGLAPLQMRNLFVVAVYHASLAFWAFGVVMSVFSPRTLYSLDFQNSSISHMSKQEICLDSAELPPQLGTFIACNSSFPTITSTQNGEDTRISIMSSPGASVNLAIQILNPPTDQSHDNSTPLFTRMVVKLMVDLVQAVHSVGLK